MINTCETDAPHGRTNHQESAPEPVSSKADELLKIEIKIMGMLCHTCQGSGRLAGMSAALMPATATACGSCEGLGYRSDHRRAATQLLDVEVGKVLAYDPTVGAAKIYLEETVQRGDRLIVVQQGLAIEFAVETMLVAGMNLSMALKGWEVTILVPATLVPGAWVMRKEY